MNQKFLWLVKKPLFWLIFTEIVFMVLLYTIGFRIEYAPSLQNDWEAISAVGQWANAVVAIIIPIVVAVITHIFTKRIEENKRDIGQSNADTITEVESIKKEIEAIKNSIISQTTAPHMPIHELTQEQLWEKNKMKALKYVNISMFAKTEAVAKHLGIDKEEAFDLLVELLRHDRAISCGGQVDKNNMDNIIWLKK